MDELQDQLEDLAFKDDSPDEEDEWSDEETQQAEGGACHEADDMTCAICLEQIPVADLAIVKGCEHQYCVHCILQWARFRDNPQCPQCKTPFGYLWTHRLLDGTLSDFPVEESVVLLKRARWFDDYVKEKEKGKAIAGSSAAAAATTLDSPRGGGGGGRHSGSGGDWLDFYDDYDAPDEDEEVEAYYFSSRAGAARVLIGNRRWGGNGYMQAGRMYARPKQQQQQAAAGGGKGKGKQAAAANAGGSGKGKQPGGGSPALGSSPSGSGGFKVGSWGAGGSALGTPVGGGAACSNSAAAAVAACGGEGSSSGQGRRARRKARREALDAGVLVDDD